MATGIVTKSLAMLEDMEVGINKATQSRNNLVVTGNRVFLPVPVDSDLALSSIDINKYTHAVKVLNGEAIEYSYDPSGFKPGVQSVVGSGKWFVNSIIDATPKSVIWTGFAGGADRSGTNISDAAFAAAASQDMPVIIPDGTYKLSSDVQGNFLESTNVTYNGAGRAIPKAIGFWSDVGPVSLHRLRDRVFVGNAVPYDGKYSPVAASFLTLAAGYNWLERSAQMHVCHQAGGAAIVGSSRSSDKAGVVGQTCIGLSGYAWADAGAGSAWGAYVEAVRGAGVMSNIFGMELTAKNLGTDSINTSPYNIFSAGSTIGLWLGAGGDGSIAPAAAGPSSTALVIGKNGQRWLKGLQFQSNGLVGTDGDGVGSATAIEMARGHRILWRHSSILTSISGGMYSDNNSAAQATFAVFTLNGFEIHGYNSDQSAEVQLMRVLPNPTAVNFLEVRAGSAGGRPNLAVQGTDTNIDLVMTAKGTGIIRPANHLAPHTTNALTCGTATQVWAGGFTQTAYTVTSGAKFKSEPLVITDDILDAAEEVELAQYQLLDRIAAKGIDGARWHFGAIAEHYVEAFAKHGLDAHRFAFICYDEWEANDEIIDGTTGEILVEAREAGSRYGIRYEEMLVLEAAIQRRKTKQLEARLAKLEELLNGN